MPVSDRCYILVSFKKPSPQVLNYNHLHHKSLIFMCSHLFGGRKRKWWVEMERILMMQLPLLLLLVLSCTFIKQLLIHFHKQLQCIVNQPMDCSKKETSDYNACITKCKLASKKISCIAHYLWPVKITLKELPLESGSNTFANDPTTRNFRGNKV